MSAPGDWLARLAAHDRARDKIVPRSGYTAYLTSFSAGAMAFLAVFAVAFTLATGRLADRWENELAQSATIRITAPADQKAAQTAAAVAVLETTPGIARFRVLSEAEQRALLSPWFGPDLAIESLPVPQLIELVEAPGAFSPEGLRLRLAAEVPAATLDDHARWRRPLVSAAKRLRLLGWLSLGLILTTTAAIVTLAVNVALAANMRNISVLRLIGAEDSYIASAFVRRISLRATLSAAVGTLLGLIAMRALPTIETAGGFLTGLGFHGASWLIPLVIPPVIGALALLGTQIAARRSLKETP